MAKTTVTSPEVPHEPTATYTVVARRYRPQQFSDLVGQEHVAHALVNALHAGRIAHAYLFTGARGVGKTSTARILAKALNCEKGPTATPCDVCEICRAIASGDDTDVIEIDGASNNKVEEIRDLRSNVGFRPQRARCKIYIIDEVHMLSNSAFNALLKTLEEPPGHVKFIFATTEVHKIPITILSRCQRFDFAAINATRIFQTLRHIVDKEGISADDDALHILARRAAGSMRDAQTLLDQLLGFCEGKLTTEKVHELLGSSGEERTSSLAEAILQKEPARALEIVAAAADRGLHLAEFLDELIDFWRGLMLVHISGKEARDLPGTPSLQEKIRRSTERITLDTVLAGIDILTAAKTKIRGGAHTQLLLEVSVVRLCRLEDLLEIAQLAQQLNSGTPIAIPSTTAVKKNSLTPETGTTNGKPIPQDREPNLKENLQQLWEKLLQTVGPMRGGQLSFVSHYAISGPNALDIRFPARYSSAYDGCRSEQGQEAIRVALKKLTRDDWTLRFLIDADDEVSPSVNAPSGSSPGLASRAPSFLPPGGTDRKKDLLKLPMFVRASEVLGAQLMKVEDGFQPLAAPREKPAIAVDVPEPDEN